MKRKKIYCAVGTVLRVLVILLLITSSGVRAQDPQSNNKEPLEIVRLPIITDADVIRQLLSDALVDFQKPGRIWKIGDISISGSWGMITLVSLDSDTQNPIPSEPQVALARKIDGFWNIMLPFDDSKLLRYNTWLDQLPDDLIKAGDKVILYKQPISKTQTIASVSGYKLPWKAGETAYLTANASDHGYRALDFDVHGTSSRGDIVAAKDGIVRFRKDGSSSHCADVSCWQYTNLVVIEHSSTEYSWYMHLAPGSIPSNIEEGNHVNQGDKIGVEGETGWSYGVHLHFHVAESYGCCNGSGDSRVPYWPSDFQEVNFSEYSWDDIQSYGWKTSQNDGASPSPCPAPNLRSPENNYRSSDRTITFKWGSVSGCEYDGYRLRIRTVSSMGGGGTTVTDPGVDDTQKTITFDSKWDNRDLYWSVRAKDDPTGDAAWAPSRAFRISPNAPPSIVFNTANGNTFSSGSISTNERDWDFRGTANDPEGRLDRIEFRCSGDNCGRQVSHTNGSNWAHAQHDMAGRNEVYFVAYDNRQGTASRHLDLRIDLAAPRTTVSLNAETNSGNWPEWFTDLVQVRLDTADRSTGHARAGIEEIHYRLDGGTWQTRSGDVSTFTVSNDGTHTVEYYAVDQAGNQENTRSVTFKIDRTPANPPRNVSETHGVVSDQWQKAYNTPTFVWDEPDDATSGVWGYQFYFGTDPEGIGFQTFRASDAREWTPQPGGVRTDTYYLRGRTRDNAGNWSDWVNLFTFRYDNTPPENPADVTHTAGITNDTWQQLTRTADFSWSVPHDEGSGIQGYHVYWGTNPEGTRPTFITASEFLSTTAICAADLACTGYLRLHSVDNLDNQAEDWTTAFIVRYDGAPPAVDFNFNGGVTQTAQTIVKLHITGNDAGSGVRAMRLSSDGQTWTTWEVYTTTRLWTIPAISRQYWPVYLQVRDGVGWESAVISHSVYLDVNMSQPRSTNFRLFDHTMSAGAGDHTSPNYEGHSVVGQVADAARITSTNYTVASGYLAGSQAIPIVRPGHDEFTFISGIFASGVGADTLRSPLYQMLGTLGEPGLPNNETTIQSSSFQHKPGFLAMMSPAFATMPTPTPEPTPGPTPTPEPTPACEFPQISVNDGALFTNSPSVTLRICAPQAEEMLISNDGGFSTATWEPYTETKSWVITTYDEHVLPRWVYAAFKDTDGTVHGVYFDDIIYDPTPPLGSLSIGDSVPASILWSAAADPAEHNIHGMLLGSTTTRYVQRLGDTRLKQPAALFSTPDAENVEVYLHAQDDNSGVTEMQLSLNPNFAGAAWESYSALKPWTPRGEEGLNTLYARFRDGAGNISPAAEAEFWLDTQPPAGAISLTQPVVGLRDITTTVFLEVADDLSGVTAMRLGTTPALTDTVWRSYVPTYTWQIAVLTDTPEILYVQYRDLAGNLSAIYSTTYWVDTTAPELYVEVGAGDTLTRTVTVLSYDNATEVPTMHLSNDPSMLEDVVTQAYTNTVTWAFDERRVVWVEVADSVGNKSEPHPAYAAMVGDYAVYLPLVMKEQ